VLINELRNITQNSVRLKGTLKFSQRGPVIQMDVHPDSWFIFWGPLLYSVDLVPAYQVDGTVFVSTPLKGETPNAMTWRRSFSIHDEDSVCEDVHSVFLALLTVHNREFDLAPLTWNHIKSALSQKVDAQCDWSDRALVQSFLGVLDRLERSLVNGIPLYYLFPATNRLIPMTWSNMDKVMNITQHILSSKYELMEILRS